MILLIVFLHSVNKKEAAINSAKNRAEKQHRFTVNVGGNPYHQSKEARYVFCAGIYLIGL